MAKLMVENSIISPNISKNYTYIYTPEPKDKKEESAISHIKSNDLPQDKKNLKLLSAGLITSGGLLFYYGLTRPGKNKIFEQFVQNKIFNMEIIANRYRTFVSEIVDSSFLKTAEFITNFKNTRFLNPSDSIIQIKMLSDPEKIANAQDLAFDAILNVNCSRQRAGTSEFGEFTSLFENIMRKTTDTIDREKHRTNIELDDFIHLPKIKEKFSPDLIEELESRLISANRSLDMFMEELKKFRLEAISRQQFAQMADAIVHARQLQTISKQNIINASFEKVKHILKLGNDFIPLYNKGKYNIGTLEEISEFLKPQKIPTRICKQTEANVYMKTILKQDLSNLSEKQLKSIFYKTPYENTLKDLRYMIDRYRLRHAVALSQKSEDAPIYEGMIIKLEYLSNILEDYGKGKLLEKCTKDFDQMTVGQRRASLYYISTVAKRLGYENLEAMDKDLYKTSELYKNSNLHFYMPIIKDNPNLYFVE